jgi:hypothetical protein
LFAKLRKKREEEASSSHPEGSPSASPISSTSTQPSPASNSSPPILPRVTSVLSPHPPPVPIVSLAIPPCSQCGCADFQANAFRNKSSCTNCFHIH